MSGGFLAVVVWIIAMVAVAGLFNFFDARTVKKRRAKYTWEGKDVKVAANPDWAKAFKEHNESVRDWQRVHGVTEEAEKEVGDDDA